MVVCITINSKSDNGITNNCINIHICKTICDYKERERGRVSHSKAC